MANTETEVYASLTSVNAPYVDAAKRDILNALSEFCDLYPGTDSYVFNDGSCRRVVTLTGTIPISYKGNTYNIPLCLYLLDTHPYNAPVCYVRPTADMMIKTSQHVDPSGKISLPYLREWRHPKSDLLGLLQVMAIVFGEQCPVFAKSSSASVSASSASAGGPPTVSAYAPHSALAGVVSSAGAPATVSSPFGPYQLMTAGVSRPLQSYSAYLPTTAAVSTVTASFGSYAGFTTTAAHSTPARPPVPNVIPSEHARLNLMTAVEEKLRAKLRESIGNLYADLQSIRKTREDLVAGEQKLQLMLAKLAEEQEYLDSMVTALKGSVDEIDKILAEAGAGEESSIDEAIDTTAPLFRQLLNAYVEDNAIEDTIYFLGQALKRNRMDLENYLKHVRMLSRQQFMLRATMQRCRRVAGLDA